MLSWDAGFAVASHSLSCHFLLLLSMQLDRSTQWKLLGQYRQLRVGNSVFLTNSSSLPQAHQQQPGCCFPACTCLMLSPCKDSTRSLITMMYVSVLGCIVIDDLITGGLCCSIVLNCCMIPEVVSVQVIPFLGLQVFGNKWLGFSEILNYLGQSQGNHHVLQLRHT